MKRITRTVVTIGIISTSHCFAAEQQNVANILNWKEDPKAICKGHFQTDPQVEQVDKPPPMDRARTSITSRGITRFSLQDSSELRGKVQVRQRGRVLRADKIRVVRNPKTQKISLIDMFGNVSMEEKGRKIAASSARVNVEKNSLCAQNGAFRITHNTPNETLIAWGQVSDTYRNARGDVYLSHASYSVCPIKNPTWLIRANEIHLDKQHGVGSAKHARFMLFGVPVLYVPYLTYPISDARKTGFLTPGFSYDEDNGFGFLVPFYWNMAPNVDDLFAVHYMTKRGFKFNNHLRYLNENARGSLYASVLPDDAEFRNFQRDAKKTYQGQPEFTPFLSRIENAGRTRYSMAYDHDAHFTEHWGGSTQVKFVSDDYYLHDFGSDPISSNTVNLFNQVEAHYTDDHWQLLARAMGYQTLHPIGNVSIEPYNRVPQIVTNAFYPNSALGLDYEMWLDYSNFDHRRDFYTNTAVVSGNRIHILPGVGYYWRRPYAFFHPMARVDITNYWLRDQDPGVDQQINRVLPIGSVDTGLIFEREGQCFRSTIEPRLFYLIVPRQNQDDIPLFDTTLPRFNFEQLFFYNRFTGYDRMGDANELTMALASRWYESASGFERFSASAGILYQFSKRSVCLTSDCPSDFVGNDKWSPLLFNATFHATLSSYFQADVAWDPNNTRTSTGNFRVHYEPVANHILHAGYDFVRAGDRIEDARNSNLSRIDLALTWPLNYRWNALANWNYNLSHSHIQHYLVGLSYDGCCVAVRGLISRTALTLNLDDNAKVDTKYYLEIKFKGLGTLGNSNPTQLLDSSIVGYHDVFRR